ncbi:LysM peptidoglycan-binding domain-containing protein [Reichenbachiella ulvae]|uniref:LysM peptidoglycan-binding domain-containing protein n=1 Tax=Reichenbachiella ulvae TaxID=2980104 RepID=A0ABT3CRD9_9BACT|nr:LysM peptidoglycan-binding domain-containing protein [Reichenbachiella ulvae]MCV9386271.1 LysM peptidoglycan-binding domain-containing protein [Reichenbachiella ulvae]
MRYLIALFLLMTSAQLWADDPYRPRVPATMEFAGMKLKITDGARKEIQDDVDMLTKSTKYFELKADRARLYFPIIEKTLKEQNVPDDFKFLSVQESALISDAVSSANAVGFWQFKDFTGREVGLRIDRHVDERLNIVSSTIGASKYFKRHNFYFDNWIYTLLAHMTGRGGAEKYVDHKQFGATRMTIDRKTHWYVKRCLAHKIAFEEAVKSKHSEGMSLMIYERGGGKSLSKIADELKVSETDLKQYNKWLKSSKIPEEKTYSVIVPVKGRQKPIKRIGGGASETVAQKEKDNHEVTKTEEEKVIPSLSKELNTDKTIFIRINGLPTILAKKGDDVQSLAAKAQLHPQRFARYNDLSLDSPIKEGEIYYLKNKRWRARTYYYTAQRGEDLWDISQKFGVKENRLARLNRMSIIDDVQPGRVMWLRKRRPKDVDVEIQEVSMGPVDETIPVKELIKEVRKEEKELEREEKEAEKAQEEEREEETVPTPEETKVEPVVEVVEEEEELPEFMDMEEEKKEVPQPIVPVETRVEERPVDQASSYFTHTVKKGETLYGISKKYGVSVQDILEWNEMNATELKIGQSLIVHGEGRPFEMKTKTVDFHVVEPGDTMYSISKKYNIAIDELLRINQKDNFALSVGERIRVKE